MDTTTPADALTDDQLAELTALLTNPKVTPGPWITDDHEIHQAHPTDERLLGLWVGETCNVEALDNGAANAELIVAARNAVPHLIAEIHRLRDQVDDLRDDSRKLRALRAAGVDNWDGYSEAMACLRDEEHANDEDDDRWEGVEFGGTTILPMPMEG